MRRCHAWSDVLRIGVMLTLRRIFRMATSQIDLVREMTTRELFQSMAAHGVVKVWTFSTPLVTVGVYLLVFGFVLGTKLNLSVDFPGDYPSYVLIGLLPWLVTQNVLARSTGALLGNANLVKQVIFPVEVLPTSTVLAVAISFLPATVVVVTYKLVFAGGLSWFALLFPIVALLHLLLLWGLAFALSALTPFVRDIREVVNVFSVLAMYFTPAVYLPAWVPRPFLPFIYANPFSYVTWVYQDVLFYGEFRHPTAWVVFVAISVGSVVGGYSLFRKLKPYWGNVI